MTLPDFLDFQAFDRVIQLCVKSLEVASHISIPGTLVFYPSHINLMECSFSRTTTQNKLIDDVKWGAKIICKVPY